MCFALRIEWSALFVKNMIFIVEIAYSTKTIACVHKQVPSECVWNMKGTNWRYLNVLVYENTQLQKSHDVLVNSN